MPPNYVALKAMDVQVLNADGSPKMENGVHVQRAVRRGDPLPEALHWPFVSSWIKQGYVGLAEHFVPEPGDVIPKPSPAAAEASSEAAAAGARSRRRDSAQPAAAGS